MNERRPPDLGSYVAAYVVCVAAPLCAADVLSMVPGLLPLSLGLITAGIPVSLFLRRRQVHRQRLNQTVSLAAIVLGALLLGAHGEAWRALAERDFLSAGIDRMVLGLLVCGIVWIIAFRALTLVSDVDLVVSIGFSLCALIILAILLPDGQVVAWLVPFGLAALFLLMRYQQQGLRERANEQMGRPPSGGWQRDARTLTGLAVGVAVLSVLFSVLLSGVKLPDAMLQLTGAPLVDRMAVWMQNLQVAASGRSNLRQLDAGAAAAPNSNVVVLRAEGLRPTLWRGNVYTYYDGRVWWVPHDRPTAAPRVSAQVFAVHPDGSRPRPSDTAYVVTLERKRGRLLYMPNGARLVAISPFALGLGEGGAVVSAQTLMAGTQYVVYASDTAVRNTPPTKDELRGYLQVPAIMSPKVRALVRAVTVAAASDEERLEALVAWLAENKGYVLQNERVPVHREAVGYFLEQMPTGNCRQFATALAVMARLAGVPTRLVDGYVTGEVDSERGLQTARERDAHAWVEAWLPGRGWTTFDVTERATERLTGLALVLSVMRQAWQRWRGTVGLGALALLLLAAALWGGRAWRRAGALLGGGNTRGRASDGAAERLLGKLARTLRRAGLRRGATESEWAFARRAAGVVPEAAGDLTELAELLARGRFSRGGLTGDDQERARRALARLARAVRAQRRTGA